MPVVNLPDGRKINFPDGTSPEDMTSALASLEAPKPSGPDQTTAAERFGMGAADPIYGVAQGIAHLNPALAQPQNIPQWARRMGQSVGANAPEAYTPQAVDATTAQREQEYQARRGENAGSFDWMRTGGNVASTLPVAALVPGASATTIPRAMASGAATGGLTGVIQPVTENQESYWSEKGKQVGAGAGLGSVAGAVGNIVSRAVSPKSSPEIQSLMEKGVYPPIGQHIGGAVKAAEDKIGVGARSGLAGEYTHAAYNDALAPLGKKLPPGITGQEAAAKAKELIDEAYNGVWSGTRRVAFDDTAAGELNTLVTEGVKKFRDPAVRKEFLDLVDDGISGVRGSMTGASVRDTIKGLRETAEDYIRSGGPRATMGRYLNQIADRTEASAIRTNAELAAAKSAADTAYAGIQRAFTAASKDVAEGMITPQSLAGAVRSGAPTNSMVAQGEGLLQPLATAGLKALPPMVNSATPYLAGAGIGGAGLGASMWTGDPRYAAAAGALGLLYTPTGRHLAAQTLAGRQGEYYKAIAEALRTATPYAAGAVGAAATPAFVK